jgi:3-oxoacyl-[acyl-carrier-protein] synthase II
MMTGLDVADAMKDIPRHLNLAQDKDLLDRYHPATLANLLSYRWRALGPLSTINTACASSGQSIGQALHQIRRGDADVMLAGGSDSIAGVIYLAAFCLLGAVSARNADPAGASRPFDKQRDGFVASEGAAMVVLEEREHALRRGARIYAELRGYGDTANAYRVTDLPEDGEGIIRAMEQAAADGGVDLATIDYINAHGTSTPLNDRIEAAAIDAVFTRRGLRPLVSSTKSSTGHLISAAGAVELAFCALALRDQIVPPTCNLEATDCSPTVAFVAKTARRQPLRVALSNLLGFGGSNATLTVAAAEAPHGRA